MGRRGWEGFARFKMKAGLLSYFFFFGTDGLCGRLIRVVVGFFGGFFVWL